MLVRGNVNSDASPGHPAHSYPASRSGAFQIWIETNLNATRSSSSKEWDGGNIVDFEVTPTPTVVAICTNAPKDEADLRNEIESESFVSDS